QVRPVFPYLHRQVIAQPRKRVHRHAPRADVGGNACTRILCRHVCHNLAVAILSGEGVQQATNVDFIPRQVPADGVCINSDAHESYQYNGPSYRPKHQKSNFLQAFSHVNSRSSKSRPALPNSCRSVEELNSRDTADANAAPPSANSRFSPSRPGRPSAPIGVETTGSAAAQASRIFSRVPLATSSGTTATRHRASSFTASSTGPVASMRGSPEIHWLTASGCFPISLHTSRGHSCRRCRQTSCRKNCTAPRLGWYSILPEKAITSSSARGGSSTAGMAFGYTTTRAPGAIARARSASLSDAASTSENCGSQRRSNSRDAAAKPRWANPVAPPSTAPQRSC